MQTTNQNSQTKKNFFLSLSLSPLPLFLSIIPVSLLPPLSMNSNSNYSLNTIIGVQIVSTIQTNTQPILWFQSIPYSIFAPTLLLLLFSFTLSRHNTYFVRKTVSEVHSSFIILPLTFPRCHLKEFHRESVTCQRTLRKHHHLHLLHLQP